MHENPLNRPDIKNIEVIFVVYGKAFMVSFNGNVNEVTLKRKKVKLKIQPYFYFVMLP